MPVESAESRCAAWRHLRVSDANRSRIVALKRSIKAVLSTSPPRLACSNLFACSKVPKVILRVTSTTRFFSARLITVAIHSLGQSSKHALPRPRVFFTFSRNARLILPGYAAHPSVQISNAQAACEQARTCCSKRSARFLRSEEHTSELQSHSDLVCRLLLEKKKKKKYTTIIQCITK